MKTDSLVVIHGMVKQFEDFNGKLGRVLRENGANTVMVKNVKVSKNVVTMTNYVFRGVYTDFMKFSSYKNSREAYNMDVQTSCFLCNTDFETNEKLGLLFNGNQENQLCCSKCSEELVQLMTIKTMPRYTVDYETPI